MKKRILSLILALSMVLSVLPLGAFAEGSTNSKELVMDTNGYPVGSSNGEKDCEGNGWEYKGRLDPNNSSTLILKSGTYNFNYTNPKTPTGMPTNKAVQCAVMTQSGVTITGGTFSGGVFNSGTIAISAFTGGTFNGVVTNNAGGTISGGTFAYSVTNKTGGTISGGTFESTGSVANEGTIKDGTFNGEVENRGTINNGTFAANKEVKNYGTINNGIFAGNVKNGDITENGTIENGTFEDSVINEGTINNGIFNGEVQNSTDGKISGGAFSSTVYNYSGTISGGTFEGSVTNYKTIKGGTFAGRVDNRDSGNILGGVFNLNAKPTVTTGGHNITWDAASSKAKIEKVNDVPAVWDPYVVIEPGKTKEVTIKADTEIFSLNGRLLGTDDHVNGNKNTVKFTMPYNENVVLSTGELVMKGGYPLGSDDGNTSCSGKDWEYKGRSDPKNPNTLTLTDGTFDFNSTYPQNPSKGNGAEPVKCAVESYATITGGTFNGTVENWNGTISGGTFHEKVLNSNGEITGGTFAAGLSANHNTVTGGVFNGKTGLDGVTGVHSITWDAASSDAKITEVNGVSAVGSTNWDPYVVVTQLTTAEAKVVTIKADTEIFSLNGRLLGEGDHVNGNKNTVKFTMPGEPVVLNGAITCTDLVMKNGWPEASKGGTIPCKGTGWEYSNGTLVLQNVTNFDFSSTEPVKCAIQSGAHIAGGTFEGTVTNKTGGGAISGGIFKGKVDNSSAIIDGTFRGQVDNNGKIIGGIFAAGLSENDGSVTGGIFNGNTGLTDAHHVTVTNGSVSTVNNEGPRNADGTTGTAWDLYVYAGTTVTITASDDIYSLNGQPIGPNSCNSSYGSNKNIVTFTMPDADVQLNYGDLVMEKGYPKASNEGQISCSGTGWSYDHNTETLTLTSGEYDFSSTEPVKCAIESSATITGGTFEKKVTNNAGGIISGGIFQDMCSVTNNGTIKNGTFKNVCSVTNNSTIENGTFKNMCSVTNGGTIKNGTFKNMCSVINNTNGTISGGTFTYKVENNGIITGGVFNGNANLTGVTGGHNITWDKASSKAGIVEVNGVSADWAPYVVTSNATTKEVTITADTDIFSLNGQLLGADDYVNGDKKAVKFTMPDEDVVLSTGELVMENGYPVGSNGGEDPCKGDGWEYIKNDPTNGDMLLLTGNSQTGGLFDFSTIGDGLAVECNVFVGKPTAITGGEFNGKVENNSVINSGTFNDEVVNTTMGRIENGTFKNSVENNGIIEKGTFNDAVKNNGTIEKGTFNGPVDNMEPGTIKDGTFHDAVENNGKIENGAFHDAVKNNGTINGGVFNGAVTDNGTISGNITGSGTLNGEPITKTPEPEPEPEPKPEPEPTTYTVTVIGGTIDGKTSVSAKENDTLTVVLDQNDIPDGMTFDLWSISSDKLSGDINVDYRAEAMTFQMPAEDVTIRAQYRSAEIIEDAAPSPLATAATVAVGGAAAGIVVWQGVNLGVDLYLANALPQGVPVPTDRRALALLLWETAGKPEVALPTLYGDIPTEEIELQKATRWAVQNGLMDAADKKDASFFDPDHYVTKMDVFGAWLRLKKLLGTT